MTDTDRRPVTGSGSAKQRLSAPSAGAWGPIVLARTRDTVGHRTYPPLPIWRGRTNIRSLSSAERAARWAMVVVLTLSCPVQEALAAETLPGRSLRAEGEADSLNVSIRRGVHAYANGDLRGSDAVWTHVRARHPEHPAAATFELLTLQARRSLDYWGGQYEQAISERAEEAVGLSRAWLERTPDSSRAHFYLENALLEMMVIDGIAKRYYKAGTEGEEARKHLERALELDSSFVDAKLPLGLYYYYGSIATRFIPFLRWLWFVPDGDHDLGLAYIREASRDGDLLGFEATLRLVGLYSYVEERPDLAEPILIELAQRHPQNSMLYAGLVELQFKQQDYTSTVATALAVEQKRGTQFGDETRRDNARIWRARAELHRGCIAEAKAPIGSRRTALLARSGLAAPFELEVPLAVEAP